MNGRWTASILTVLLTVPVLPGISRARDPAQPHSPSPASVVAPAESAPRSGPGSPAGAYDFPTARERFLAWALNAAGPSALGGSVMNATWGQWVTDEPPEWDGGLRGFSKRFGTGMATTAITETSLSLLSAAMSQDAAYYRSPRPGFGPRLGHALKLTVFGRGRDGSAAFSPAKTVSPFVGPIATRTTLYPDRYSWRDGAVSGACGVLLNAGWNIAKEFVMRAPPWWRTPGASHGAGPQASAAELSARAASARPWSSAACR